MKRNVEKADVLVIGGGLVGLSAALAVARAGVGVILLERGSINSHASGANFGGVRLHGRDAAEMPLAIRARSIWGRIGRHVGSDCEYLATGHTKLALIDSDMDALERWRATGDAYGVPVELLGRDTVRQRFPWLAESIAGASFCAGDGHANPRLAGPAFARAAREAGARIMEHVSVERIEDASGGGFSVRAVGGDAFEADTLINAAGAWGARLAAQYGVCVPLAAVAPQMFVTEPAPYRITPVVGVVGAGLYLRQSLRGNVIFGGGRGTIGPDGLRSRPIEAHFDSTIGLAQRLIPHIRHLPIIRAWTGIEGTMPDGLPVIGQSSRRAGLFHAFGFSGHGFQMAPAVGETLAELLVGGHTGIDLAPFDPDRFASLEIRSGRPEFIAPETVP
jgi:sarcosine oxidase subunit beta